MAEKNNNSKPSSTTKINEGATKGNIKPTSVGPKTTPPPQQPPAPKK